MRYGEFIVHAVMGFEYPRLLESCFLVFGTRLTTTEA